MSTLSSLLWLVACDREEERSVPPPGPPSAPPVTSPGADPGTRTLGRLNANEYDRTVRDLLGTAKTPGEGFPTDEVAYGFDNIATVLTTTSIHVELWEAAADELLDELFGRIPESTELLRAQVEQGGVTFDGQAELVEDQGYLIRSGSAVLVLSLPFDGLHRVIFHGAGVPEAALWPEVVVSVDGEVAGTALVNVDPSNAQDFSVEVELDEGVHTFAFTLANPSATGTSAPRSLFVDWLGVEGPLDPQVGPSASYPSYVPCGLEVIPDRTCAEAAIEIFGRRAWRRALTGAEVDWALGLYDAALALGDDGSEALQYTFKACCCRPSSSTGWRPIRPRESRPARWTGRRSRPAWRSSSGRAPPTRSCWPRPRPASSRTPTGSSSKRSGCWPTRARTRWWTTWPASGSGCASSRPPSPTRCSSRSGTRRSGRRWRSR